MKSSVPEVGPLQILEQERDHAGGGEALEECPPGAEQLGGRAYGRLADTEQRESAGSMRRRSASSGTYSATMSAILVRVVAWSSVSSRRARDQPSRPGPRR